MRRVDALLAFAAGLGLGAATAYHLKGRELGEHAGWMRSLIDELTVETQRVRAAREELELS